MKSTILGVALLLVSTFLFGWIGGMLGERFQRRRGGTGLPESGCAIFGAAGLLLAIWLIGALGGS
jgi:hypothetical protein